MTTRGPAVTHVPAAGSTEPVLVLEDVVKVYRLSARLAGLWGKPTRTVALEGVSLAMARGEVVCLTGPSGSGKSTLAALAAGARRPTRGAIRRTGTVAYIPQDTDAAVDPRVTVAECLEGRREPSAFADAGLPDLDRFLERGLATLSGGERQRLLLGRALAARPALIVADEPLSLVDIPTRAAVLARLRERLRREGTALLYVTHDALVLAALAGRVVGLDSGRIVGDTASAERVAAGRQSA